MFRIFCIELLCRSHYDPWHTHLLASSTCEYRIKQSESLRYADSGIALRIRA